MKGIVSIFGGVNTKLKHYKLATDVYQQHNMKVNFYEGAFNGFGTLVPSQYRKNVEKAKEHISKYPKRLPKIIHCNSGGFWSGLEVNSVISHQTFLMESAPFNCYDAKAFKESMAALTKFPVPNAIFSPMLMRCFGIPTPKYNPRWFEDYEANLLKLKNVVHMVGEKDHLLDADYLSEFQKQLENAQVGYQRFGFLHGKHHNIAKSDIDKYQSIIDSVCKKIKT